MVVSLVFPPPFRGGIISCVRPGVLPPANFQQPSGLRGAVGTPPPYHSILSAARSAVAVRKDRFLKIFDRNTKSETYYSYEDIVSRTHRGLLGSKPERASNLSVRRSFPHAAQSFPGPVPPFYRTVQRRPGTGESFHLGREVFHRVAERFHHAGKSFRRAGE